MSEFDEKKLQETTGENQPEQFGEKQEAPTEDLTAAAPAAEPGVPVADAPAPEQAAAPQTSVFADAPLPQAEAPAQDSPQEEGMAQDAPAPQNEPSVEQGNASMEQESAAVEQTDGPPQSGDSAFSGAPYPPYQAPPTGQGTVPPGYGYRPPVYGQPYYPPQYQQPGQYPHPSQYQQPGPYGPYPGASYPPRPDASQHVHPGSAVTREMLPKSPPREPKPNRGLRIFVLILALVMAATGLTAGGYYMGRNARDTGGTSSVESGSGNGLNLDIVERGASKNEENLGSSAVNAAASKVAPSVVGITVYSMTDQNKGSEATGIVLTKDGYILTNDHIYADVPNAQFLIETSDKKEYQAKFVAGDSRSDLAVLKIDGVNNLVPAVIGNSNALAVGESVIAVGNPYGSAFAGTVTKGIISAVNRRVTGDSGGYSMKCIQTDTAINPGNSGGPLVNMEGQVVGINSSKIVATGYEGIGFAIPSNTAVKVAESLVRHGYVADRSRLGISYQAITTVTSLQNDIPTGLYIREISADSDMNGKGVSVNDIITHVGDTPIKTGEEILDVIEDTKPGQSIQITVHHTATGKKSKIIVKLLADKGSSSYVTSSPLDTPSNPFKP